MTNINCLVALHSVLDKLPKTDAVEEFCITFDNVREHRGNQRPSICFLLRNNNAFVFLKLFSWSITQNQKKNTDKQGSFKNWDLTKIASWIKFWLGSSGFHLRWVLAMTYKNLDRVQRQSLLSMNKAWIPCQQWRKDKNLGKHWHTV